MFINPQAVEMSNNNSYWHCRLLFQLASIHAAEKDYASAVNILGAGVDFSYVAGAYYTRLLFMLSKTMARTQKHLLNAFISYGYCHFLPAAIPPGAEIW